MNDDKNIRINLGDIASVLDQEQFGMLIDAMIAEYAELYGVSDFEDAEPDMPNYECENLSEANSYLKKFQLQ